MPQRALVLIIPGDGYQEPEIVTANLPGDGIDWVVNQRPIFEVEQVAPHVLTHDVVLVSSSASDGRVEELSRLGRPVFRLADVQLYDHPEHRQLYREAASVRADRITDPSAVAAAARKVEALRQAYPTDPGLVWLQNELQQLVA